MGEVIGAAAVTGAPLHIVHINSMCMRDVPECLDMVAGARGLDVTTEAGADADIVVFDPALFEDESTYNAPLRRASASAMCWSPEPRWWTADASSRARLPAAPSRQT